MGQDSSKVIVPGHGRFWLGNPDSPPPGQIIKVSGNPTAAVITMTVATIACVANVAAANSSQQNMLAIAQALAGNLAVGAGKVFVFPGPDLWTWLVIIDPSVVSQTITATATYTAGATPSIQVLTSGRGPWTPFSEVGHTSKESPLQINRSGGDVTAQGSWQAENIDSSTAAVGWALAYALLQQDLASLKLYHGSNAVQAADGTLQASKSGPSPTENSLFLLIQNGGKAICRDYPRVSTLAADGESFDVAKLAGMPVASTVLSSSTASYGYSVSQAGVAA
ncbi:MAG: hypothetical protein ABI047_03195 [Jatrophihabitantaceae bacterium]